MTTTAEQLAQRFHEAYERLAPSFGYETREASAKPWADVPEQNRGLMVAVCAELLEDPPASPAGVMGAGEWRIKAWWKPIPGVPVDDPTGLTVSEVGHELGEVARRQALSLSQCRGILGVVLYDPDGEVVGHYDRFSNIASRGLWRAGDTFTIPIEVDAH